MGRSNPCLSFIPCAGGDPAQKETDELDVFENKNSKEKRGWSFRRKSPRHQVLSNSLITESRPSGNKSTLQSALLRSPSGHDHDDDPKLSEKVSMVTPTEHKTHQLSVPQDSKVSGTDVDVSTTTKNLDSKASEATTDISTTGKNMESEGSKTNDVNVTERNMEPKASDTDNGVIMTKNTDMEGSETNDVSIVEKNMDSNDHKASADVSIVEKNMVLKSSHTNDGGVVTEEKNIDSRESGTNNEASRFVKEETSEVIIEENNIDSEGSETNNEASRILKEETSEVISSNKSDTDEVVSVVEEEVDRAAEEKLDESVVIFIQAAIRGFLARRELLRLKKAVKLQAAYRGHLVRRNAVGALRCVQAIVKMQALVRARISNEGNLVSAASDKENMVTRGKTTPASLKKLLENKFARQLMDSTSKKEPIGIKCDASKPNSAWNWLERWMSVSSSEKPTLKQQESDTKMHGQDETEAVTSPVEVSTVQEISVPVESEEIYLSANEGDKTNLRESETADSLEQTHFTDVRESVEIMEMSTTRSDSCPNQCEVPEITNFKSVNETSVPPECTVDAVSSEKSHLANVKETDLQIVDSHKDLPGQAVNPAFISARSKFEELALSAKKSEGSPSSVGEDVSLGDLESDVISSTAESKIQNDERVQFGGSEGEAVEELGHETKDVEQESRDSDNIVEKLDIAVREASVLSESVEESQEKLELHVKESTQPEIVEDRQDIVVEGSVVSEVEQKQETVISTPGNKNKNHFETETGTKNPSPESQATSVNASSAKAKKEITEKSSVSSQKRKSGSSKSKKSPSNPKLESGGGSEQSGKDHKSGKRRISFGQDHEPKENGANGNDDTVIPRFMKPTESARAKVGSSPRSSPDVQERDKKRQSLPGAEKKQGSSPRIQRSLSQAPQGTKERKWLR